jgi:hypothetical protein
VAKAIAKLEGYKMTDLALLHRNVERYNAAVAQLQELAERYDRRFRYLKTRRAFCDVADKFYVYWDILTGDYRYDTLDKIEKGLIKLAKALDDDDRLAERPMPEGYAIRIAGQLPIAIDTALYSICMRMSAWNMSVNGANVWDGR